MVKAVIGDETQLKSIETRLLKSSPGSQVGLVIGKLSSKLDRGFVYDLIPTPLNDAGEPPCSVIDGAGENRTSKRSSSKAKSQPESSALFIDSDWVSEHARQVSRMLPGGMKVIGIYIWVNENLFKSSTLTLCQTIRGVAEGASQIVDCNDRLLLHISYSPLRWSCRSCTLASNISSSNLHPCDYKMGKIFGSIQTFRCTYNFEIRLPIFHEDRMRIERISDVLQDVIVDLTNELGNVKTVIDGKLVTEDDVCVSDDFHEVEFLAPLFQDQYLEACIQKKVAGVLYFMGSVCSLSYLNSKEPVSQALADIKEDIIRSLQSRLEILQDEGVSHIETATHDDPATGSHKTSSNSVSCSGASDSQIPRKWLSLALPRRVFIPWLEGAYISDYLQSSETIEVLQDHCSELMSMELPTDSSEILEPEVEAPVLLASTAKNFWDFVSENRTSNQDRSASKTKKTGDGPNKSSDINPVSAILILVISIVLGIVIYFIKDMQIRR